MKIPQSEHSVKNLAPTPNDIQLHGCIFNHAKDNEPKHFQTTWSAFHEWLTTTGATAVKPDKKTLPMVRLATFTGSTRSKANLGSIYGLEGDYDGESVTPEQAVANLQTAGIEAVIATSPSHRPEAPRWRVLAPLSEPVQPAARYGLVARLNGALGGILAPESFDPARCYFVGSLQGGRPMTVHHVAGACIDTLSDLAEIGPATGVSQTNGHRHPVGTENLGAPSWQEACIALTAIPANIGYDDWQATIAAFVQAAWRHAREDQIIAMIDIWCASAPEKYVPDEPARKVRDAIRNGTGAGWNALHQRALPYQMARDPVQLPAGAYATEAERDAATAAKRQELIEAGETTGAGIDELLAYVSEEHNKTKLAAFVKRFANDLPVAFDLFSQSITVTGRLAWESNYPRQWTQNDTRHMQIAAEAYGLKPSKDTVFDGVNVIAQLNKFHSVRNFLDGLVWDGVPRLDNWLTDYLSVPASDWTKLIGPKVLLSAVARITQPGCKVDNVLVLEGEQGVGKSTAVSILFGDNWFADSLPSIDKPDAAIQLAGKWCIEIAELSAMKRADVESIKAFVSRRVDRFRAPYDKSAEDHERQSVFIGTTNRDDYLKDDTGNRRFWPVLCDGALDFKGLKADRDQLWAEALARYRQGERWWLEGAENDVAQAEQSDRREDDPWELKVMQYLATSSLPVRTMNILHFLNVDTAQATKAHEMRIGGILSRNGYVRRRIYIDDKRVRAWTPKDDKRTHFYSPTNLPGMLSGTTGTT